jgi:uncharacterized membrane protein
VIARVNETALRIALGAVSVVGLGVAGYLTMVRLEGDSPSCIVGGGCKTVQESEYSEMAGIPVAVLGLLAYAGLLLAALLPGPLGRALGLFVGLVSFGFSMWLTFAELFIIEAICAWCVTSAVLVTLAAILVVLRAFGPWARQGGSARRSEPDLPPPGQSPPAST